MASGMNVDGIHGEQDKQERQGGDDVERPQRREEDSPVLREPLAEDESSGVAEFVAPFLAVRDEVLWTAIAQLEFDKEGPSTGKQQVFLELGSGDGRACIYAAKTLGLRCIGLEIDQELREKAEADAEKQGVGHLCEFRDEDIMKQEWAQPAYYKGADLKAVFVHLLPEAHAELEQPLLALGCPLILVRFSLPNASPAKSGPGWDIYNWRRREGSASEREELMSLFAM